MDWVSLGSITGGSQAEARGRTPPRFGGLGLAGIQSGYGAAGCAASRRGAAPTASAVMPAPVTPTPLRKSRRVTVRSGGVGREGVAAIGLSFRVGTFTDL